MAETVRRGEAPVDLPDRLRTTPLPERWVAEWEEQARQLGPTVAVRSSAMAEDGRACSFAGIHSTELGVSPEEVGTAVLKVWASAFSSVARSYGVGGGMAVLLQPMVQPEAAGVVFTINPQNGSYREMVVEGVRGQGEALVSGRQAPQWAILRRSRRGLRLVEEELAPQPFVWSTRGGALRREARPGGEGRLLTKAQLLALCRLCLRVERLFGEPVDVEWGWSLGAFVLFQARPITAAGVHESTDVLWTRRFLGERWASPPTPMTWSVLAPELDHLIGYPKVAARYLGGGPSMRRVGGHAYLNVTVFRHLLFKWPGAPAPSFMLELLPSEEVEKFRHHYRVVPDLRVYWAILETTLRERRWERFAWNPFTNHAQWSTFSGHLQRCLPELKPAEESPSGAREALEKVEGHIRLLREYLGIHICSLLFANLFYQLLEGVIGACLDGPVSGWMESLASSEEGNRTLELNQKLVALGERLGVEGREELAKGRLSPAVEQFLEQFGARAEASWEIFSPRWRDVPEQLVPLMEGRCFQGTGTRPSKEDALRDLPVGTRHLVIGLVFYTRRYLLLRENQRFAFEGLMAGLQAALIDLGRALSIPPRDLCWYTLDELREGVDGGEMSPENPSIRRREAAAFSSSPPVFLRGDLPADAAASGRRLEGLGISGGRTRGKVRVLRSLAEAESLLEGEILVAPAIDPGWTPLLLRATGLILELGSRLSHGAVIAREYGVPGVVNLTGITRTLVTGMEVTVDGGRGLVWIHSALDPEEFQDRTEQA